MKINKNPEFRASQERLWNAFSVLVDSSTSTKKLWVHLSPIMALWAIRNLLFSGTLLGADKQIEPKHTTIYRPPLHLTVPEFWAGWIYQGKISTHSGATLYEWGNGLGEDAPQFHGPTLATERGFLKGSQWNWAYWPTAVPCPEHTLKCPFSILYHLSSHSHCSWTHSSNKLLVAKPLSHGLLLEGP